MSTRVRAPKKGVTTHRKPARKGSSAKPKEAAPEAPLLEPINGNREEWLIRAISHLRPMVRRAVSQTPHAAPKRPFPIVSVGWPGGRRSADVSWSHRDERTGQSVIYLSPELGQGAQEEGIDYDPSVRVLDVLLHELIHDAVGHEHGHMEPFQDVADELRLIGYTHSRASEALQEKLAKLVSEHLGEYPHRATTPQVDLPGHRRQKNRQRKYTCQRCGKIIRSAGENLQALHLCDDGEQGKFALSD